MKQMDGDDLEQWSQDVARAQKKTVAPQRIANVLGRLMARRGYAQVQSSLDWESWWHQAVGASLAKECRVGNFRRSVLEITVRNSSMVQELTFQKKQLLARLRLLVPGVPIKDLRFLVGGVNE